MKIKLKIQQLKSLQNKPHSQTKANPKTRSKGYKIEKLVQIIFHLRLYNGDRPKSTLA